MSGQPDLVQEFTRRMQGVDFATPGASASQLLEVMEPAAARLLALCAIPHRFDAEILAVLAPDVPALERAQRCEDFSGLSFVSAERDAPPDPLPRDRRRARHSWAMYHGARERLFREWFAPGRAAELAAVSGRLAEFFRRRASRRADEADAARREAMFHLLAADPAAGFREAEELLRRARDLRQFGDCAQLLRLVHEYDGFLPAPWSLWLAYRDAQLAANLHRLEAAEAGYRGVLDDANSPDALKAAAWVRLGYVHHDRREVERAIGCYQRGLAIVERSEPLRSRLPRILHDLGAAYRDLGQLERAKDMLDRSVRLAEEQQNLPDLALAWNALGTLALKRQDVRGSIAAFEASLDALERNGEIFRTAQIYDNLGLAYSDLLDWDRSLAYFRKSLEIGEKAGDTHGQATALTNLARAQAGHGDHRDAIESASRAIALFSEIRDAYDTAVALRNRGKFFRVVKDPLRARADLESARDRFLALGNEAEAARAAADLAALGARRTIPWWAWAAAAVLVLVLIGAVGALLKAEGR